MNWRKWFRQARCHHVEITRAHAGERLRLHRVSDLVLLCVRKGVQQTDERAAMRDAAPLENATPITYGDAVEVAQWPCCGYKVGRKFRVNAMERSRSGFLRCQNCGERHESSVDALDAHAGWNPVAWLKRIEPSDDIPQGTRLG